MRRAIFYLILIVAYAAAHLVVVGPAWGFLATAYARGEGTLLLYPLGVLALGWVLAPFLGVPRREALYAALVAEGGFYLYGIAQALAAAVQPRPAFGAIFIPYGWRYVLLGYLALGALLFAFSLVYVGVQNRLRGRKKSVWPFFGYALIHLFLVSLVVLVFYPVIQVVAASFDPTNNLFSFRRVDSPFLLVRAKVLPDLSRVSLDNYRALLSGVRFPLYQQELAGLAIGLLLGALALGPGARRGIEVARIWQNRFLFGFAAVLFLLVIAISPAQFTGIGTETKFLLWVRNTLLLSGATGLLAVALTAPAGYAFARFDFPGRYPTLLTFIFVQMFPGFLALIAIFYLLSALDLLNTFTGLLLAYSGGIISFGSWVYKGYIESLGKSLEEAAYIDGATRFQAFLWIILPLSAPIFVFIFLLQFVGTYSEFILANLVLTGVEKWTVGVGLYSFTTGQFQTKWGIFAAASVLGSLPILLIFYGFQQYFVSGYTAGAVKE